MKNLNMVVIAGLCLLVSLVTFQNCSSGSGSSSSGGGSSATGPIVFGYDSTNDKLVSFRTDDPSTLLTNVSVTGLAGGEKIKGMDFRPATGALFGLAITGASMRVVTINTSTGAVTTVGSSMTAQGGLHFGFSFNATVDRFRFISDSRTSARYNTNTGALVLADTTLTYDVGDINSGQTPRLVGASYNQQSASATTSTLFALDSGLDTFVQIGGVSGTPSANGGLVFTLGSLGVDTADEADLEIAADTGTYYAALRVGGSSNFYTLDSTTGAATLVGTIGDGVAAIDSIAITPPTVTVIYAHNSTNNHLLAFQVDAPGVAKLDVAISGLSGLEKVRGLDFRPADGLLYALVVDGTTSRICTVNTTTGALTTVGSPFTITSATYAGFDFNPVADRIRYVSEGDSNERYNPSTGALASADTALAYAGGDANTGANPQVVNVAYTNNTAGATTTVAYGIDVALNILTTIVPPNAGTLNTVGSLGITTTSSEGGFDIAADGTAYAILTVTTSNLYTINLSTGAATSSTAQAIYGAAVVGSVYPAGTITINAMAVAP